MMTRAVGTDCIRTEHLSTLLRGHRDTRVPLALTSPYIELKRVPTGRFCHGSRTPGGRHVAPVAESVARACAPRAPALDSSHPSRLFGFARAEDGELTHKGSPVEMKRAIFNLGMDGDSPRAVAF